MESFVDLYWNDEIYYNQWLQDIFVEEPLLVYEALRDFGFSDKLATRLCEDKEYFNIFKFVVTNMWWEENLHGVQDSYREFLEIKESEILE